MKRATAALLLAGLLLTSGCLGFLTGQEALQFQSGQATVSQQAQADAGYEKAREDDQVVTRTFETANQTREVEVTNHVVEYKRQVSLPVLGTQELARFTVLATPKVTIAGQGPFNPVGDLSNRELAEQLQEKYETVQNVQLESNRTVTVLGEETRVSKFAAEAQIQGGQTADVYLHLAQAETEDDFVVMVAVYPQDLDGEQQNVDRLLEGVQHEPAE